jgi:hypothetical protein
VAQCYRDLSESLSPGRDGPSLGARAPVAGDSEPEARRLAPELRSESTRRQNWLAKAVAELQVAAAARLQCDSEAIIPSHFSYNLNAPLEIGPGKMPRHRELI